MLTSSLYLTSSFSVSLRWHPCVFDEWVRGTTVWKKTAFHHPSGLGLLDVASDSLSSISAYDDHWTGSARLLQRIYAGRGADLHCGDSSQISELIQ